MKERLKSKTFWAVFVVILYKVLQEYDIAPSFETYQLFVDTFCYVVMGFGVYKTYESTSKDNEKEGETK